MGRRTSCRIDSERAARIKCLFVLTYETCKRKQTIIYQSVSGGAILGASSHVVVWLRTHICGAASRFFHHLQLQPVVILRLRADWLSPFHCRWVYFLLNYATHGSLTSNFCLHWTLSINLGNSLMVGSWLVVKNHLVRVRCELASRSLVQVTRHLALARATTWIGAEIHMMPHLNLGFPHVCRHVDHLWHQILVGHLNLLFRLLVLACRCVEVANLQVVRNALVALPGERGRCSLLVKHLSILLLRLIILNHHCLGCAEIVHSAIARSHNSRVVVLVSFVLHQMHQLIIGKAIIDLASRLLWVVQNLGLLS